MKILIVTQYFWPESFKINDLAQALQEQGHEVTVLTGMPNYPKGVYYPGYSFLKPSCEMYNGIKIRRVPIISRGKSSSIRLVLNYFSFVFFAAILGFFYCPGKFDNIFVFEPSPITVGIPAVFLKKIKKAKLFFWVQDLWPESLIATGTTKSSVVIKLVDKLARWIYKHCDKILVQCVGFKASIEQKNVSSNKIIYFPNWAETIYQPYKSQVVNHNMLDFPRGFVVLFAGNLGAAQSLDTIVSAAKILQNYQDIHFVFLGDGRQKANLEEQIKVNSLKNIHVLGQQPVDTMPYYFSLAQVMLVTLKKDPAFAITIPSKIQSYLACAKPIIGALDGYGADIIKDANVGLCGSAEDATTLAENVLKTYKMNPDELAYLGKNGFQYSKNNFNREKLINKLSYLMAQEAKEDSQR